MKTRSEHIKDLIRLITENPEMDVIPLIHYEVVGGDYGYWGGEIERVELGWFCEYNERRYSDMSDLSELMENEGQDIAAINKVLKTQRQVIYIFIGEGICKTAGGTNK